VKYQKNIPPSDRHAILDFENLGEAGSLPDNFWVWTGNSGVKITLEIMA
jgi:hypothetical protein